MFRRFRFAQTLIGVAVWLCSGLAAADSVAWQPAANDADIERAFGIARAENKPVLLYWGAKWCPPCNQLKATLFNRHDFIERSKSLVPVEIDGDRPGAQKLGSRFKVSGYPTMVLVRPDGAEITRLPGEADAPQVLQLLQLGLAGGRPTKAVLADARAGKAISGAEWRMLAFYSWITDESQLVPAAERAGVLASLAAGCPASEADSATRLMLKALADSDDGKGVKADAALRAKVRGWLADPKVARAQMDVLTNYAGEITKALSASGSADRKAIVTAYDSALQRLQADTTLSRADRLTALNARVDLARIDAPKGERHPKIAPALQKQVRELTSRATHMDAVAAEATQRIDALATRATDARTEAETLRGEVEELRRSMVDAESLRRELSAVEERSATAEQRAHDLAEELVSHRELTGAELERVRAELTTVTEERLELAREAEALGGLRDQLAALETAREESEERLSERQRQLDAARAEADELRLQLHDFGAMREDLDEARTEIESLRAEGEARTA
ncbi:MAG TPA: thioredoxin fold domain-containing protein, partial [Burkholderiaceae bacterium]|nr:thioredoxin fold domain-containing protein [Burkholderiaceae bacterium]